jgi:hypothetical protein
MLVSLPTARAYETTEEARLLLCGEPDPGLLPARRAAGEAAYYLSDTIEPDERASLLNAAERHLQPSEHQVGEGGVGDAVVRLNDAAVQVEQILRGPDASSELRIALRALRRALGELASDTGLTGSHLGLKRLRGHPGSSRGRSRL